MQLVVRQSLLMLEELQLECSPDRHTPPEVRSGTPSGLHNRSQCRRSWFLGQVKCVLNKFSMARGPGVPQSILCQLSKCPTSLLNFMLNHPNRPQSVLFLRQSREVVFIGLENHSNDVKSTVIRSVDQFHVMCIEQGQHKIFFQNRQDYSDNSSTGTIVKKYHQVL